MIENSFTTKNSGSSTSSKVDNLIQDQPSPFVRRESLSRTPPKNKQYTKNSEQSATQKYLTNQEKEPQARFLVIKRQDGQDFYKISPFAIQKSLFGLIGELKQIKKIKNGLLVETVSPAQSNRLLQLKMMIDLQITVEPHVALNTSKGVIICKDLLNCTEQEILEELTTKGVTDVKRIKTRINGQLQDSPSHILTFNTPKLPSSIKVAFHSLAVRPYVPAPLRCYRCQQFGHSAANCTKPQICICGKPLHEGKKCEPDVICVNCKGTHNARSRDCPVYKTEVAIQQIKTREKITYFEAKKKVIIQTPKNISYAQATEVPERKPTIENSINIEKLIKELIPAIVQNLKHFFVMKQEGILQIDYRRGSVSSIPSEAGSEKRKRNEPNYNVSTDAEEESADDADKSQKIKKPKGWPKGKPRKPPDSSQRNTSVIVPDKHTV